MSWKMNSQDVPEKSISISVSSAGAAGHVGLLEMVDELHRLLALGFAHRLEDAYLRHSAEIVVGGRTPAGRRHVEVDGPR